MKLYDTPIETYKVHGVKVDVKREDLCTRYPAPPFSKVRGLMVHLKRLKKAGITVIGYVETSISMAGWGVAACCDELGLKAVIYKPIYKQEPRMLAYHHTQWDHFGCEICEIPAGRARVNYYICIKEFREKYGAKGHMLDLGLPLNETVDAVASIACGAKGYHTIVVNIGSGTICAGIMKGIHEKVQVYGVMGRAGSISQKIKAIQKKGGFLVGGLFGKRLMLIDEEWEYTQKATVTCPFPCHPYYDLKAWSWLVRNVKKMVTPILFWNIGSMKKTLP